jgi:hypothetical protein
LSESSQSPATAQKFLITLLLTSLVALSWSGSMERLAGDTLQPTFQRALLTAAIARGLNGVISVAQGTEIAIAPVGVGITITAGQILDPLNDLVERFSWLALAASASLGTQMLLAEIFSEPAMNVLLSATAASYLLVLWWPSPLPRLGWLLRAAALLVFARFLFTLVMLTVGLVDHWVLEERQQAAIAELTMATRQIESLEQPEITTGDTEQSILERFESALDGSRQALDIDTRLNAVSASVEASVSYVIDLIVVFLVQTVMLPIVAIYAALACFRWFWRWSLNLSTNGNPQMPLR